ncbi:MAG: hypothetical protein ACRCZI_06685 [Cetobacterium sp.]
MNKDNWPDWLKIADTRDADVELYNGGVVWHYGTWKGGIWQGGEWQGGVWQGGVWQGGIWQGGIWQGGVWQGGIWQGGIWRRGVWEGEEVRLHYMAALCGIHRLYNGNFVGYRTTRSGGRGRFTRLFIQTEGEHYESVPEAGNGTCCAGIHITSSARAWTHFGIDSSCEFWRVEVKPEDLLDCDGEKARIRGGIFKRVPRPF